MPKHLDRCSPIFLGLTILALSSCTTRIQNEIELPALSTADKVLDEWGSVTASPPIISIPADEYEFKIDKTAGQYYQGAKDEVNAGILQHTKTVFSFLLAASSQADATSKAMYNNQLTTYQDALEKQNEGADLTEEEKEDARNAKQAMIDGLAEAAKENFTSCKALADKEGERVVGELSATDAIALNNAAVERRKACLNDYQAELAELEAVSQLPDFPTLPENNVPSISRLQATPFGARTDVMSEDLSLSSSNLSGGLSLPDYNALPQAATNKFLADMLATISSNKDESAYFGVSMISVNPGWRTKEGYHAVINLDTAVVLNDASKATVKKYIEDTDTPKQLKELMEVFYFDDCDNESGNREFKSLNRLNCEENVAEKIKAANDAYKIREYEDLKSSDYYYPINVTAISPVTYAQTQELQNRQISQINLSLMLAATLQNAGLKESAEAFADFSRQRRKEFGSRSADNNVSVFSTGSMVGLEVQPEFFAASWNDSEPNETLQQQTFPILLRFDTIGANQHEELVVAKNCDSALVDRDYCLLEPVVSIIPSTRWKSADRSPWLFNWKEQLTTQEMFNLEKALRAECDGYTTQSDESWLLVNKCAELRRKLFGEEQFSRLPDKLKENSSPKSVKFTHIFPSSLSFKKGEVHTQEFVLIGKGFDSLKDESKNEADNLTAKVSPVFDGVEVISATLNGNTMTVRTKISDAQGPIIFVIDLGNKAISTAMNKNAIASLKAEVPDKQAGNKETKTETLIKLTADGNQSISVSLPDGVDDLPSHVKEVLMSFYENPDKVAAPKNTKPSTGG